MAAFEYSYSFSADDEIIRRYSDCWKWYGYSVIEIRIKFIVKGNCGERIIIDSEGYATGAADNVKHLQCRIGRRLKDCWMPDLQIGTMAQQLFLFVERIRVAGRRGKIPVGVDVEVCTVQREGEAMAAAVERAMRPELLPPLYLYPMSGIRNPSPRDMRCLTSMLNIRVDDVDEASSVMDVCRICCRRGPILGTQISVLPCGHVFHYHCTARRLLEESNSCPVCLGPGFNIRYSLSQSWNEIIGIRNDAHNNDDGDGDEDGSENEMRPS